MIEAMSIHTVFCPDCGGWVQARFDQICPHEGHIRCDVCNEPIALVQTKEPEINNKDI